VRKRVYTALGVYFICSVLLTTFYDVVIDKLETVQMAPTYFVGRILGAILWSVVGCFLIYKAGEKKVCKCKKCNHKNIVADNTESKFGNPFFSCEECGEINYNINVIEPALLPESAVVKLQDECKGRGRIASLVLMLLSCLNVFLIDKVLGIIILFLLVVFFIVFIVRENRESGNNNLNEKMERSIVRLASDEVYLSKVIAVQGLGGNSAWKKYKANPENELYTEPISEYDKNQLFLRREPIYVKKKEHMWKLFLAVGIAMFFVGGIHWIREENAIKENLPSIKEISAEYENSYYMVEGLMGPALQSDIGYYYIALDGDDVALVYIKKDEVEKYRKHIEWVYSQGVEKPEKIKVYGYSEGLTDQASDILLEVLNSSFGDIFSKEMIPELFGEYVLVAQDVSEMHADYIYEASTSFIYGCLLILLAVALLRDTKNMKME